MMRLIDFEHDNVGNLIGVTVDYDGERIELERVRHGEWKAKEIEKKGHCIMKVFVPVCSVCDATPPKNIIPYYCPNCGAKMDGGEQDANV